MKTKLFLILLLVYPAIAFTQGTWKEYRKEVNTGLIQGGNNMSYFSESKDGSVWVSNTTGSIVRILGDEITIYDDLKRSIASQTNIGQLANAREKTIGVWWFSQADMETGWVWFASNRGIVLWDNEKLLFLTGETNADGLVILLDEQTGINYILNKNIIEETDAVKNVEPTKDIYNFYAVYIDSKKRVWFGGSAGRLYCIDNGVWKKWDDIVNSNYSNDDKTVRQIFEDNTGTINVVCHGIFCRIDNNTLQFDDKIPNLKDATGGFEDSKGNIWISGRTGVYKYSEGNWTVYGASEGIDVIPLAGPITEDKEGNIWFAGKNTTIFTKSTGIFKLKPKGAVYKYDGSKWTKYKVGKTELITDLFVDNQGNIWVAESIGIYKFNGESFDLLNSCSKTRSYLKIFQDSKGDMWFGRGSFKGEIDKYIY